MSSETFAIASLVLNFSIGGFVVLTTYRVKKIEATLTLIRKFLARHTDFNIDNLTETEKRATEK